MAAWTRERMEEGEGEDEELLSLIHICMCMGDSKREQEEGREEGGWRDEAARSLISHGLLLKIFSNLPIWWKCLQLKGKMVNKGRIQREIRKFLIYSSKLIKSDDELMIEIRENY